MLFTYYALELSIGVFTYSSYSHNSCKLVKANTTFAYLYQVQQSSGGMNYALELQPSAPNCA